MNPALLEVRDLRVHYHTSRGAVKAVDGVSFSILPRRALRPGRRIGLRQIDDRAGAAAPDPAAGQDRERRDHRSTAIDLLDLSRRGDAAGPPGQDRPRRAGRDELAQSGPAVVKDQIRDGLRDHGVRLSRPGARRPRAASCCDSVGLRREVADDVPARAERRHEAARLHRHRHQPAPEVDHRRRADQRARRRRPAAGHGDAACGCRRSSAPRSSSIGHDMGLMAQVVDRVGVMYAGKLAEVSTVARSLPASRSTPTASC